MKQALLVSPYFVPCNLAGVHRARLLAKGLPEFGWQPTIIAAHPRYYGRMCEPHLAQLLPEALHIEYVNAIPAAVSSRLGITDLSLRAFWTMRKRMGELLAAKEIDLVFVSVLPGYAGLLGAWAKRHFGVLFVLDYQDPWVSDWGASQPRFSKAGVAHRLAEILEPRFAPVADAITAVSNGTLDGLRNRGLLRENIPTAELPIGSDPVDHEIARRVGTSHLKKEPNSLNLAYLGTVPEGKLPVLREIFRAMKNEQSRLRVILHLIGTSAQPDGADSIGLGRLAAECGATDFVRLEPRRIPYLDALRTMQEADALLMLGSTESHYTASKIFPYWLAERPIVGVAHAKSTVWEIAQRLGGVRLFEYANEGQLEEAAANVMMVIADLHTGRRDVLPPRNADAFEPYSARGIARSYAQLFDNLLQSPTSP
jgi:hypothetical protein